ncbi:MAG: 50S ribosomal protein L5 [Thaumarchaeota archaeon]|nr:50S ribosomal protein L5 [Nitrososphaerota archaeon]
MKNMNLMTKIFLDKIILNICTGKSGNILESAKTALDQITNKKSSVRNAKKAQRDWGVRKGEPIAAAVTIRKRDSVLLLKRLLLAKKNKIPQRSFDNFGNFSFGIKEHIDIPGIKYDPQIGIFGLNVSVSLARLGFNIRLKRNNKKIGQRHRISLDDAKKFMIKEFDVELY